MPSQTSCLEVGMLPPSSGEQSLGDLLTNLRGSYHLYSAAELQELLEKLGYSPDVIAQVVADREFHRSRLHSVSGQFITGPTLLIVMLSTAGLWLLRLTVDLSSFQQALALLLAVVCASGSSFVIARRLIRKSVIRQILSGVLVTSVLWSGILLWEWWQNSASTLLRIYDTLVSLANDYH